LFQFDKSDGAAPADLLLQATDGNFYGTTVSGGGSDCGGFGCGTVFKLTPAGKLTELYNCNGGIAGFYPFAPLIEASDGNFYGAVQLGGPKGWGTVFKITSSGELTLLHSFTGGADGSMPMSGLVQATDGNLYGTAQQGGSAARGVLFRITPKGKFSVLHNFDGTTSAYPMVTLIQHTNGKLYGDTFGGGPTNRGTSFSFDLGVGPFISLVSTFRQRRAVHRHSWTGIHWDNGGFLQRRALRKVQDRLGYIPDGRCPQWRDHWIYDRENAW